MKPKIPLKAWSTLHKGTKKCMSHFGVKLSGFGDQREDLVALQLLANA